jgi:hypothetical protein
LMRKRSREGRERYIEKDREGGERKGGEKG